MFRRTATTAFTKSASFPAFAFFTTPPTKKEPLADSCFIHLDARAELMLRFDENVEGDFLIYISEGE